MLGLYGVSFGAVSVASGLDFWQTAALSALAFTGGSQFALVGILGGGGSGLAGTAAALLLGLRNGLYGVRLAPLLQVRGLRRLIAAQWVIDETTGLAVAESKPAAGRAAFWVTGATLFVAWNTSTWLGAAGASVLDPVQWGLDAVAPAAFLALLSQQVSTDAARVAALMAATVVLVLTPLLPVGVPVLLGGLAGMAIGARLLARAP